MFEVDLMLVVNKLKLIVFLLGIGNCEDLVCLVFDGK